MSSPAVVADPPEPAGVSAGRRLLARWPLLAALLFLIACLPFLATTLDDWDAFNFAFGVRDYDPRLHQPHPPGYPLYIGLAKTTTAGLDALRPESASHVAAQRNAALGLAIWSAVAGALALLVLPLLFTRLTGVGSRATPASRPRPDGGRSLVARAFRPYPDEGRAIAIGATLLTACCPLFWFTSLRPLSDVPGLAAALAAQALILVALSSAPDRVPARFYAACFFAALIIGLRSQTMWLTLPLLVLVAVVRWRALSMRALSTAVAAFALGVLAWAVPMVIATGGWEQYLAALAAQGAEDFSGVDMFYRNPTPARFARGLEHTFVWPWASEPLAKAILWLAAAGGLRLLAKAPRALALGVVAFGPYAAFHLLFHETITTRYALPLVPPVAWLAAAGAAFVARRLAVAAICVVAIWGVLAAWPAVAGYDAAGSPVARAVDDMGERAAGLQPRPAVGMHDDMRRAVQWMLDDRRLWPEVFFCRPGDEVGCVARYLDAGGPAPVLFLANPRRTDLASFDPAAVREVGRYAWQFEDVVLAGNPRPSEAALYELSLPGWFVLDGWALNPEIGGRSTKIGRGPSRGPIEARIRRRDNAAVAIFGGRHVGPASSGAARVEVTLDGRPLAAIEVPPDRRSFLRRIDLPAGALQGDGTFARLGAVASGGGPVAVEQFDLQDSDRAVFGFSEGWHEPEYSPARGLQWRWASERATLLVHNGGRDIEVEIRGESPLRYFDRPTRIVLAAGSERIEEMEAAQDFVFRAVVSRGALERSGGLVTLESDQHFTPLERGESADARHLALRVYGVSIRSR